MFRNNFRVFQTLTKQVGLIRACQLTLMKVFKRVLAPGCNLHYGQTCEDIILKHIVEKHLGKKEITYVDVGCHDPRKISSTYFHYLQGSSGLAIDMGEQYGINFKRERPKDVFVCAAVSDSKGEAFAHEFSAPEVNTINGEQAVAWGKYWQPRSQRLVKTYPLSYLVSANLPVKEIDVLLLDVEGHELEVLKGADLSNLKPKIIVCEIHELDLMNLSKDPVTSLLLDNGYRIVAYATMNGYFVRT